MKKGFTLVEMMVTIAIIGMLASFVMIRMQNAREKGIDSAIRAEMDRARSKAEEFYDINDTYDGVCISANGISTILANAAKRLSSVNTVGTDSMSFFYNPNGGTGTAVCHDRPDNGTTPSGWAAIISLKKPKNPNRGWCVDSSGNARESSFLTGGSNTGTGVICPSF